MIEDNTFNELVNRLIADMRAQVLIAVREQGGQLGIGAALAALGDVAGFVLATVEDKPLREQGFDILQHEVRKSMDANLSDYQAAKRAYAVAQDLMQRVSK